MTASWVSGCGDKCFDSATSFSCKDSDAAFCMSDTQNKHGCRSRGSRVPLT